MTTQCNAEKLAFHELDSREVVGRFDGGEITSGRGRGYCCARSRSAPQYCAG